VFGAGGGTSSYREIEETDLIVLWGSNARETHPIFFHHLLRGVRNGARLYAVDPRRTQSERVTTVVTGYRPAAGALLRILAFFVYPLTSLTVTRRKERTDPPFAATMGPVSYALCSALFLNVTLLWSLIVAPLAACWLLLTRLAGRSL